MQHLLDESTTVGISTDVLQMLIDLASRAVSYCDGGSGFPAIVKQLWKPTQRES